MGKFVCILFLFLFQNSIAQWKNLGKHNSTFHMPVEGIGYSYTVQWLSPGSGYTHYFYKSLDNGSSTTQSVWNKTWNFESYWVSKISFVNDSTGIMFANNQVYRTTNECKTWDLDYQYKQGLNFLQILLASYRSPLDAYFVIEVKFNGLEHALTHRTLVDTTEFQLPNKFTEYKQMEFVNDSTGLLIADSDLEPSTLIRTQNSGQNFSEVFSSGTLKMNQMCFPSEKIGYICADSGKVYKTSNAGITWSTINLPESINLNAIAFMNDSVGYVGGEMGTIYKTSNGGTTWSKTNVNVGLANASIIKLFHFKSDVVYALTNQDSLYKTPFTPTPDTSIDSKDVYSELILYPNPASDQINLNYPTITQESSIEIFDALGRKIYVQALVGNKTTLALKKLPDGVYFLRAQYNGNTLLKKFIKAYEN